MPSLCLCSLIIIFTLLPYSSVTGFTSHSDPNLVLIGDATLANDGDASFLQLTDPSKSSLSSGFVFQKLPFKFLPSISFSTDFSFTISPHNGVGLAFLIVPTDFPSRFSKTHFALSNEKSLFGVVFDASSNHVGVNVGGLIPAKSRNVSSVDLVLNSGRKLHSWVDYDSTSKRVEVRLCAFGSPRPYNPLLVYHVDFGNMWKGKQALVGLTSSTSSGNLSRVVAVVYSWKFRVRSVPQWLHSHPLDPSKFENEPSVDTMANKKRFRFLAFLSGFIFATGCVALATFVGLFLWVIFGNTDTEVVNPTKSSVHPGDYRFRLLGFLSGFIFGTGCLALATFIGLFLWVVFGNTDTEVVNPTKSSVHPGDFRYEKVNVVIEDDGSTHVKN